MTVKLADGNIVEFDSELGKKAYWHTCAHILAQAVKRLYPDTKLTVSHFLENGFNYDFDTAEPFTPEDMDKIEAEMKKIVKEELKVEKFALPRDEAIKFVIEAGESYKKELIEELPEDEEITFYKQGEFTDLCAGPHLSNTAACKALKLVNITGAYWRANADNKMLQRVYGISYPKKSMLEEYLVRLEEAKKRDHRKLGRELDLFDIYEEGPGFPFFMPKGMVVRNEIESFWREYHRRAGYVEISTPMMLNRSLWEKSGHWFHYKENMYTSTIDETEFAIKPMNCPGGLLTYNRKLHSYRDLPIRMGELGVVHRHELSGALHGLMRVRKFTQDDAHIFMTAEQIKDEIVRVIRLTMEMYEVFGFQYKLELSTKPENAMGTDEIWEYTTSQLEAALVECGLDFKINEGDGAFYGPKIDWHLTDSIGRSWQCGTIQLDMNLPERFDATYIGADGEKHRPFIIHRTVLGSIERFFGILIEHFAGAFPMWLAPVQVKLIPITDRQKEYAQALEQRLFDLGIRVEGDYRAEKMGFKIREAQLEKIPYMLVIGDKEIEAGVVAVRSRKDGDLGTVNTEEFINKMLEEINTRAL